MKWLWWVLALAYLLFPFDLLPDFAIGLGWIDDLIILLLIYFLGLRSVGKPDRESFQNDENRFREGGDPAGQRTDSNNGRWTAQDPHAILGVRPGASSEEIQKAFHRLATQYHPDKVAHLGEEFRNLAEEKFKKIQNAYDRLKQREL
ncbi:MAG: DnaJ domain-containing protein [Desulfobacterales bacterium]